MFVKSWELFVFLSLWNCNSIILILTSATANYLIIKWFKTGNKNLQYLRNKVWNCIQLSKYKFTKKYLFLFACCYSYRHILWTVRKRILNKICDNLCFYDDCFTGKGRDGERDRRHNKGCNCKRSGCLKNYCECYEVRNFIQQIVTLEAVVNVIHALWLQMVHNELSYVILINLMLCNVEFMYIKWMGIYH